MLGAFLVEDTADGATGGVSPFCAPKHVPGRYLLRHGARIRRPGYISHKASSIEHSRCFIAFDDGLSQTGCPLELRWQHAQGIHSRLKSLGAPEDWNGKPLVSPSSFIFAKGADEFIRPVASMSKAQCFYTLAVCA